jgi:DNA repair protein RadC
MSMIKDIDISNRPREKMIREGIERLTDEELIAIIIGSGTKGNSALDIARDLISKYGGLNGLLNCNIYSLMEIKGIKKARSITLIAILEIAKRANKERIKFVESLKNADDVYNLVKEDLENEKQENFLVIYLNIKLHIIKKEILFKGGDTSAYIDVNMMFKNAILCGAKNIICVHNHPSGDSSPSKEDMNITENIRSLSKITKINLLDHIIVGKNEYFSFKEMGM